MSLGKVKQKLLKKPKKTKISSMMKGLKHKQSIDGPKMMANDESIGMKD